MPTLRERTIGAFLGVAIGDALGMPVETYDPEQILNRYPDTKGKIDHYIIPRCHKWFDGRKAGTWTDDTQLTLATAKGLMASNGFDMKEQVNAHIDAFNETTSGWGGTTRKAVKNLAYNKSWEISGISSEGKGKGNGVVMKLMPIAILFWKKLQEAEDRKQVLLDGFRFVRDVTIMTHRTEMAICASFAHTVAFFECLSDTERDFNPRFVDRITRASKQGEKWAKGMPEETDKITDQFTMLPTLDPRNDGSCYLYNSLPFTYYYFLQNPNSIESLYDCVSAGGDSDSNGSMLAAMLGTKHGPNIFPQHLLEFDRKTEILSLAEEFCDVFGLI